MLQKTKNEVERFRDFCLMKGEEAFVYEALCHCATAQFNEFEGRSRHHAQGRTIEILASKAAAKAFLGMRVVRFIDIVPVLDKYLAEERTLQCA